MSPNTGWSTTWILSALRDNQQRGELWSYKLHDTSTKFVPAGLAEEVWHFVLGDAKKTIPEASDFDYLFIDSDHSALFAEWYIQVLLPRVRQQIIVSVHDVFHRAQPSEEGKVVFDWLKGEGIECRTVASGAAPEQFKQLAKERHNLGSDLDSTIHSSTANPMMFFEMT